MPKYHISSSGLPSRCEASVRDCPVGGAHGDFEDSTAAREWTEQVLANQYNVAPTKKEKPVVKKEQKFTQIPAQGKAAVTNLIFEDETKMRKYEATMRAPRFDEFDAEASWSARERHNYAGAHASHLRFLLAAAATKTDRSAIVKEALEHSKQAPSQPRSSDAFQTWQAREQAIGDFLNAFDPDSKEAKDFNNKLDNEVSWHYN